MRFIGNKEKLAPKIYHLLQKSGVIHSNMQSFFDVFSGSVSMGRFFRNMGFKVYSCDILYFSYCLQRAYLQHTKEDFKKLLDFLPPSTIFNSPYDNALAFLNSLQGQEGFISKHYAPNTTNSRTYFTQDNARKIDSIRIQIQQWRDKNLIDENEYFILIATLLESISLFANVAGVYAAFCKTWDKRALKPFMLKPLELTGGIKGECFHTDSVALLQKFQKPIDILYLDPPYNQRQYAPNYHLLETIARYDEPHIRGVAGLRDWHEQKSLFCNAKTAMLELEKIIRLGCYKSFVLSYNSEGLMQKDNITALLDAYGNVKLYEIPYPRFKSNNKTQHKNVFEYVWVMQKLGL